MPEKHKEEGAQPQITDEQIDRFISKIIDKDGSPEIKKLIAERHLKKSVGRKTIEMISTYIVELGFVAVAACLPAVLIAHVPGIELTFKESLTILVAIKLSMSYFRKS